MKYFQTKHEKNAARITALIMIILILLLFIVGPPYLDPPKEYGVAVNFGTTDFGSGNKPLSKPRQAEIPKKTVENIPQEQKVQPKTSSQKTEDVLTAENAEEIAIKKQKQAEAKAKAEAERIERVKRESEEKKRKEEAEKKKMLDQLIGGVKKSKEIGEGGEGPDNAPGNKGKLNGDPYAPSYFGGSGPGKGGVGYGLGGRGIPSWQITKQNCNEYGLVVFRIVVDRSGRVISATPDLRKTQNAHPCLLEPAKKIAESHKWPADAKAPTKQIGYVSINFDISQ